MRSVHIQSGFVQQFQAKMLWPFASYHLASNPHGAVMIVAVWRCKCGAHVKAVDETSRERGLATQIAACPNCCTPQIIDGDTIISIAEDAAEDVGPDLPPKEGTTKEPAA